MSSDKRVALITGSTSGIGLSCAHVLAKRGVDVIVTGSRDASCVREIVGDLRRYGVRVDYVSADLSKLSDIERLWTEVTLIYPDSIDILINNAGPTHDAAMESFPDELWDKIIATNLTAPFQLTKRCLPAMKKKGWGRIINMSSIAGHVALNQATVYTTTKHGLIGMTKGVALEYAAHGITCNAVCPGFTLTPLFESVCKTLAETAGSYLSTEEFMTRHMVNGVPTKKIIKSDQVAELVEFLCLSNASSQMTGASYLIDGGFTAQ